MASAYNFNLIADNMINTPSASGMLGAQKDRLFENIQGEVTKSKLVDALRALPEKDQKNINDVWGFKA